MNLPALSKTGVNFFNNLNNGSNSPNFDKEKKT